MSGRPRAERWGVVPERGRKNCSGGLKGGSVRPALGPAPFMSHSSSFSRLESCPAGPAVPGYLEHVVLQLLGLLRQRGLQDHQQLQRLDLTWPSGPGICGGRRGGRGGNSEFQGVGTQPQPAHSQHHGRDPPCLHHGSHTLHPHG